MHFKIESVWALLSLFKIKYVLHFFENVLSLQCKRPIISDINLEGVRLEKLWTNFLEWADELNGCIEILTSGLVEATTFPPALLSPEFLELCINHYDVRSKSILNKYGEPVLSIFRETIASVLCLPECTFAAFSPIQSLAKYREIPNKYCNILARKWTETNYGGGSRIPKIVTKDHLKPHIHDLVVFLQWVKGSTVVFLFEDWMFLM